MIQMCRKYCVIKECLTLMLLSNNPPPPRWLPPATKVLFQLLSLSTECLKSYLVYFLLDKLLHVTIVLFSPYFSNCLFHGKFCI